MQPKESLRQPTFGLPILHQTPMKLLATGDIHYNLKQFDWLVEKAPKFPIIVIAGDLLDIAGHVDLDTQILVVKRYLKKLSETSVVLVCSGNHDGDHKNEDDEYMAEWLEGLLSENVYGDTMNYEAEGWSFTMCPWWDGPVTRSVVAAFLESEAAKEHDSWFLIYHAPPSGAKTSWSGKRTIGDELLETFITDHQPEIVLSGHIHNAPFRDGGAWADRIGQTWVFNPGRQPGELPCILVFDLAERSVVWESLAGREELDLNERVS